MTGPRVAGLAAAAACLASRDEREAFEADLASFFERSIAREH